MRRLKQINPLLLIAGFSFALSFIMFSSQGFTKLVCERLSKDTIRCSLTRSIAFGLVDLQVLQIASLRNVQVDEQIKESIEVSGNRGSTYIDRTPVYGVLLISDERTVFDGYSYNYKKQKSISQEIHSFLTDPNQSDFILRSRNYSSFLFIIITFTISIVVIFIYFKKKA